MVIKLARSAANGPVMDWGMYRVFQINDKGRRVHDVCTETLKEKSSESQRE